jgi:hypothetical protein
MADEKKRRGKEMEERGEKRKNTNYIRFIMK